MTVQRSLLDRIAKARWDAVLRGFWEYSVIRHMHTLAPRHLQVNVTYRCNSRCTMCSIWQIVGKRELTLQEFERLLQDDIFRGIERLTLAGGEPSMRPDLVPLSELFVAGMPRLGSLTLVTNGLAVERILRDATALLDLCRGRGISLNVSVSLDGVGEIHDQMRGVPGAFSRVERCLQGLQELQAKQPFWLGASCVITKTNLHHLRDLQTWCDARNIELGYQLVGFHETYVANVQCREQLDFDASDQEHLYGFMERLARPRSVSDFMSYYWDDMLHMYREGRPRSTPCPFAVDSFVLDACGDMYYCLSERKIGNCLEPDAELSVGQGPCSALYYDADNLAFREQLTRSTCLHCNSACFVNIGIKKDLKRFAWFLLGRRLGLTRNQ